MVDAASVGCLCFQHSRFYLRLCSGQSRRCLRVRVERPIGRPKGRPNSCDRGRDHRGCDWPSGSRSAPPTLGSWRRPRSPSPPDPTGTTTSSSDVEGERNTYRVAVPASLAAEVGHPGIDSAELVRQSFVFLLEREPAHSILQRFNLEVIERYFPEYRAELAESSQLRVPLSRLGRAETVRRALAAGRRGARR